jgi:endogenous inhibitor of DNA gyrase (YacG/DUF329 family)
MRSEKQEKTRIMTCPQCGRKTVWEGNSDRPFCSQRCRDIDLGSWASERYRVPCSADPTEELLVPLSDESQ